MGSSTNEAVRENLALSLGEFFAQVDTFSQEAESKTKEQLALAEELALVKEQLANQAQGFFNRETALNQKLSALRQAELEANKKLHDKGQSTPPCWEKLCPYAPRWWNSKKKLRPTRLRWPILKSDLPPERCNWAKWRLSSQKRLNPLIRPRHNSPYKLKSLRKPRWSSLTMLPMLMQQDLNKGKRVSP